MAVEKKEIHCEPQLPFQIRNSKVLNGNLSKISQSGTKLFISLNATKQKNGKLLRTNQCSFRDTHDRVHFSQKCCGILSPGGPRSGIYTVTHVTRCTILSFQLSLLS